MRLAAGYATIPKLSQLNQGDVGHDVAAAGRTVVAVGDGVGGWVARGVNPRAAAALCVGAVVEDSSSPGSLVGALDAVLTTGDFRDKGTTTLAAARLDEASGSLACLCVGDSIVHVYRRERGGDPWTLVADVVDSTSRVKYNCPQQVGQRSETFQAVEERVCVKPGDVVLVASDGVGDNLTAADICRVLDRHSPPGVPSAVAAHGLALHVAAAAFQRSVACLPDAPPTPFEAHRRAFGRPPNADGCGKQDDISVAVGIVAAAVAVPATAPVVYGEYLDNLDTQ
jgi:hypothetical protein